MNPEGSFLWVGSECEEEEPVLLEKIKKWT
jgi:hypothetical protein